jgi:hypothetical protein
MVHHLWVVCSIMHDIAMVGCQIEVGKHLVLRNKLLSLAKEKSNSWIVVGISPLDL